ncbi:hypothetical protein AX16_002313 [Volvariella volvacea WC 439]|nr:hypothetical protein AX16_002313 [Volvariella volvacea WC 439]
MLDPTLAQVLELQPDAEDSEASLALLSLVLAATSSRIRNEGGGKTAELHSIPVAAAKYSLAELYSLIIRTGAKELIEPLTFVPVLAPVKDQAADDLLALIGECGSAKEVVIVAQEVLEMSLKQGNWDDDEHEGVEDEGKIPYAEQLLRVVQLLTVAFPRLKLRRKSALETLEPLFKELWVTLDNAGPQVKKEPGRALIQSICRLTETTNNWVDLQNEDAKQKDMCKGLLRRFLEHTVSSLWHTLQSSVAQRTLQSCFPRLRGGTGALKEDWKSGDDTISFALAAYESLGTTIKLIPPQPSHGFFILHTHWLQRNPAENRETGDLDRLLSAFLPLCLASIQRTSALDETLSFLLNIFHQSKLRSREAPIEVVASLTPALASLASGHPDPAIRHQAFKVLSLLLGCTDPSFRLTQLSSLVRDEELPPMRVAAVGLVKEAILEALSPAATTKGANIIASPKFLQVFAPILFQLHPKDIFDKGSKESLKDFQESVEPARLTECLALLYVLLKSDTNNLTGIRDRDNIVNVQKSFLTPIRDGVELWLSGSHLHDHAMMPLVSLQISLQRVDTAITDILQS